MYSVVDNNNSSEQTLQNMQEFRLELKEKKKKLDEKTKFQKALRAVKNNTSKSAKGHHVQGANNKKSDLSPMYAMVLAIAMQMNTNLQSMGVQAQHVQMLDQNNTDYNAQMDKIQEDASNIKDYTNDSSLTQASEISTDMSMLGNQISSNQTNESKDSAITQGLQTNTASDSSIGQSLLDLEKHMFKSLRFKG